MAWRAEELIQVLNLPALLRKIASSTNTLELCSEEPLFLIPVSYMRGFFLLENKKIIEWCHKGITAVSLINTSNEKLLKSSKLIEDAWGNKIIRGNGGGQWTTVLCQDLVKEALIKSGKKNVRNGEARKSSIRNKKYNPDLECDEFVYEVKGRNWCTPGTAGEKILGVPIKYGELPRLYQKPLKIVLVGYQEYEARNAFGFGDLLNSKNQTPELKKSLAFYKNLGIEYEGFTDILKRLSLNAKYSYHQKFRPAGQHAA